MNAISQGLRNQLDNQYNVLSDIDSTEFSYAESLAKVVNNRS